MVNGPTSACGPRKLAEDAIEVGGECSGRLGHEEDDRVALGEGVSVIAVLRCHPSVAADTVQLLLRVRVTPLGVAKDDDGEVLLSVAKRNEVSIGAGGGASAAGRAIALCAGGEERSVALELPARGRGAKADQVRDVSLVDVGVVAPPLSLGGGGPVSLVGQLDRANWQGVARDAGERTVDGCKCGVVAVGGVGGIEAMVAEALVLGDGNAR